MSCAFPPKATLSQCPSCSPVTSHTPTAPQECLASSRRGNYLQYVVARVVTVVPDPDLCAHVPATEGAGGKLQAANLEEHVGDCWQTIPLQAQVLKPFKPAGIQQGWAIS